MVTLCTYCRIKSSNVLVLLRVSHTTNLHAPFFTFQYRSQSHNAYILCPQQTTSVCLRVDAVPTLAPDFLLHSDCNLPWSTLQSEAKYKPCIDYMNGLCIVVRACPFALGVGRIVEILEGSLVFRTPADFFLIAKLQV